MKNPKIPLAPARLRRIPRSGFSWIDRRFVRDGHIEDLPREAIALYLFLCTVADATGMSFYADPTLRKLLKLDHSELLHARNRLVRADLIAYRYPLYQVLALPQRRATAPDPVQENVKAAKGEPTAIADVIHVLLPQLKPPGRRPPS